MSTTEFGIDVRKPVSLWNKPISIEPKSFFLNLAKAAINGTKLELDDAFENLMDALQARTCRTKPDRSPGYSSTGP